MEHNFTVGDEVKLVGHSHASNNFHLGEVVRIQKVQNCGSHYEIAPVSKLAPIGYCDDEHLAAVTTTPLLKIGDTVKVIDTSGRYLSELKLNDLCTISESLDEDGDYELMTLDEKREGWRKVSQIVKIEEGQSPLDRTLDEAKVDLESSHSEHLCGDENYVDAIKRMTDSLVNRDRDSTLGHEPFTVLTNPFIFSKEEKPLMTRISNYAKKVLDADTRALVEAGYLSSDLELTEKGQQAVLLAGFEAYKKDIAAEAKAELDEAKKKTA